MKILVRNLIFVLCCTIPLLAAGPKPKADPNAPSVKRELSARVVYKQLNGKLDKMQKQLDRITKDNRQLNKTVKALERKVEAMGKTLEKGIKYKKPEPVRDNRADRRHRVKRTYKVIK